MYFLRRAPYEGLARMRERGSRVTLVTRAMYIQYVRMYHKVRYKHT